MWKRYWRKRSLSDAPCLTGSRGDWTLLRLPASRLIDETEVDLCSEGHSPLSARRIALTCKGKAQVVIELSREGVHLKTLTEGINCALQIFTGVKGGSEIRVCRDKIR